MDEEGAVKFNTDGFSRDEGAVDARSYSLSHGARGPPAEAGRLRG
jgi:hypothetical protein